MRLCVNLNPHMEDLLRNTEERSCTFKLIKLMLPKTRYANKSLSTHQRNSEYVTSCMVQIKARRRERAKVEVQFELRVS